MPGIGELEMTHRHNEDDIRVHREDIDKLELRPCPWCGTTPRIDYEPHPDEYEWKYTISCPNMDCPMAEVRNYGDVSIQKLVDEWSSYFPELVPVKRTMEIGEVDL